MESDGEVYRCAYCLQPLEHMDEPRQLPCKHVFCTACVQEFHTGLGGIECLECKALHENIEISQLPRVGPKKNIKSLAEGNTLNSQCDVCNQEPAVKYCPEYGCRKKICSEHLIHHDAFFGSQHVPEDINVYLAKYKNQPSTIFKCRQHQQEALVACEQCFKLNCIFCDFTSDCEGSAKHQFISVMRIDKKTFKKKQFKLLKPVVEEVTRLHRLEKHVLQSYEDLSSHCLEVTEKIEAAVEQEIQLIRKKGVVLIDKVAEFSATRVQHTELFLTEVQTRRDTLQGFDKSMRRLLSADSYLPVLLSDTQNLRKMIKVSQGLKQLKYSDCDLSRPEKPVLVGQRVEDYHIEFAAVKLRFTGRDEHDGGQFFTHDGKHTLYQKERTIYKRKICGSVQTTSELDDGETVYHIADLSPKWVCLASSMSSNDENNITVKTGTNHVLFTFPIIKARPFLSSFPNNASPCIATSSKWIAAINGNNELIWLYNRHTRLVHTVAVGCCPSYIHIPCEDDQLYVADKNGDFLVKFAIDPASEYLQKIWICYGVHSPCAVTTDTEGHILVASYPGRNLYLISLGGTLVQKQHLKDLPDSKISALCVDKQKLTVASGGTLYTFHIDH